MKITMYELLGMVKDGKTPKRIIYDQYVYVWTKEDENYTRENDIGTSLNWDYIAINCLNEPVEILNKSIEEEKKIPEKLTDILKVDDLIPPVDENMYKIWKQTIKNHNKINEICDYLKSKGE